MSDVTEGRARPALDGPRGAAMLRDPLLNKGTAFTRAERLALGLDGLLPPHVFTLQEQVERVLENFRNKKTDLERYIHLISLQDRNETLFYRVLVDHLETMMPIVYTPTVGLACQHFGHIFRRSRGMYVSIEHRGQIARLLENWPRPDVRAIVMTDGERTLGLGDQGVGGMGIPIGKLALYTACAGIHPAQCLPVMLDVGTENEAYLNDPLYMGIRQRRLRGAAYDDFVAEFITAAQARWPKALLQFEDFGTPAAFRLLESWRDRARTFNDDVQGTAAVALAGLLSALRLTKRSLHDQRIVFLGAGEAGVGIADLIVSAMVHAGIGLEEAREKCWLVDSKGLVIAARGDLAPHKRRYAHQAPPETDLIGVVRALRPTAIIGVAAATKAFDRAVIEAMSAINERPIVFALSNPTSKSECSAEEAYAWSQGRAVFASGSPFPAFEYEGKTFVSGQCNNVYIFPGVALGVSFCEATRVTEGMFFAAAKALVECVSDSDLAQGRVFPSLSRIREISARVACAVAAEAFAAGLSGVPEARDLLGAITVKMWDPQYPSYAL